MILLYTFRPKIKITVRAIALAIPRDNTAISSGGRVGVESHYTPTLVCQPMTFSSSTRHPRLGQEMNSSQIL